MSFAGVGTYAGGGAVQGGVFFGSGDAGLLSPGRPSTVDSGVSGFGKLEFERDGDILLLDNSRHSTNAESSGRSIRAESSEQSTHAESSRSGHAESSSGTGIRARVSSLRTHQTLSALIPAFMKRARRKSKMAREEVEEVEKPRGRKDKKGKRGGEQAVRHSESRPRTESSRVRTEASHPRTDSVSSSCPVSDDEEEDVSPVSSHLDLLSADPFASTVALKVGAWSEMYAAVGSQGRRKSSSVPRDSGSSKTFSDHLPPIIDSTSADYNSDVNLDCASSLYDDDSEEESSIRIYSHGRGRSLSQPDVYTIPIEPLHQSNTAKRSGSSLGGRRRRPALPPRPSLPTLSTLSRANVVIPMPRTTAAARFPAEPWNAIEQGTGASSPSRPLAATRGLGSLVLPVPGSPGRGAIPFPRSPMRSRMGSIVGMGSESSIAEDEDEYEEDEEQTGSTPSVAGGSEVWWSGPSSRGDSLRSSRRGSFVSSAAAEDEELEEVTVSMPVQDVARDCFRGL
ncbi:hypothetical protein FRC12_023275 [Ceratobasidium sp. 428]|nr:hypothetical protein FRC12_023275 [Ceratobasidium sp. 428]